ncbi:TIGR03757 family integrating conjugative element protein [Lelliottia amnigena]|uniref:TIGR03757 family integrating conjugative element protein n=1 Tax=Lelliottia amnigena TaxID=61646 RepID=UPI004056AF7A
MNASLIALLLLLTPTVRASDVMVFTDRTQPVHGVPVDARLVELDLAQRFENQLNTDLPSNTAQAARTVRQRLTQDGSALQLSLAKAYQGVTDAWRLGIRKVPAVVVDQRYVVYGEADVPRALAHIAHYQKTHP